jgi:AcrR family transcriptional regulator
VDDERAVILGSAWAVLERSGFEGLKVQLVARGAGVSARTFYRHFADKDALLIALLQDEMARAAAHLRAVVGEVDDPPAKVRAWIEHVIGAAADEKRVHRARLFSAQQPVMRQFPSEVVAGTELLVQPLRDAIQLGADSGLFPWARPADDAALVYALTGNELSEALGHRTSRSVDEIVEETTAFVLRALGVTPR